MKKFRILSLIFVLAGMTIFATSCEKDDPDDNDDPMVEACDDINATYDGDVKAIINNSCAYSGCHSGEDGNTFIPEASRDYTTFAGIEGNLTSGSFNARALEAMNMPPAAEFIPEGRPLSLTENELEILNCWKDAGYPEN